MIIDMIQPKEPKKEDCCNSGCNPCIFEVYEKQLKLYEKSLKSGENEKHKDNGISQLDYTPFILIAKHGIGNTHMMLVFRKTDCNKYKVWWNSGDHFLVKNTIGENTSTRAYTPLRINKITNEEYDFTILIKRYVNGQVSNYLFSLNIGDKTFWRGPYGSYKVDSNKYSRVVMIAQGTGIAPFFCIIKEILDNEEDMSKIILYYCCCDEDIIPLRDELYSFKSYWNFSYKIFLSSVSINISLRKYEEPIEDHRLNFDDIQKLQPFTEHDQFLLCGSTNFSKFYEKFLIENFIDSINIISF